MTRVCLIGAEDVDLRTDLLAYDTARDALSQYDLGEPFANTLCVETISIGAAVSLLNDLNWYLLRLVDRAIVLEPSVSSDEWLSRALATAIRNEAVAPEETGELLAVYGVVRGGAANEEPEEEARPDDTSARLTEPMFAQRVDDRIPTYDLHEVDDVLVVRVLPEEFGG